MSDMNKGLTREVLVFGGDVAEALNAVVFAVDEHRAWGRVSNCWVGILHPTPGPTLAHFLPVP